MPKYAEIRDFLGSAKIAYEFEYRVGRYIFDLALPDRHLLVEFDGPEHRTPSGLRRDVRRDATAFQAGWQVFRIPVRARQIVPASLLEAVL